VFVAERATGPGVRGGIDAGVAHLLQAREVLPAGQLLLVGAPRLREGSSWRSLVVVTRVSGLKNRF